MGIHQGGHQGGGVDFRGGNITNPHEKLHLVIWCLGQNPICVRSDLLSDVDGFFYSFRTSCSISIAMIWVEILQIIDPSNGGVYASDTLLYVFIRLLILYCI